MKVLFLTLGTETMASSRTRVHQYFPYLEKAGIQCFVICMSHNVVQRKFRIFEFIADKIHKVIRYIKIFFFSMDCDVIFIQKILLRSCVQNLIRILNKNIIFDFDDAIYASPRACSSTNNDLQKRFVHTLLISKGVVLENNYAKEFVLEFNKNILMITGPIDCRRYFQKVRKEDRHDIVIGWIGSPTTTVYLKLLLGVFKKIIKNYPNVVVELIGATSLEIEGINLVIKDWALDTEVENLQDFDIGIMPLPDDKWSRGKGGYKLLQYMAVGIPCVASPVGINSALIKEGVNGYLANSEDQWYDKLETLIKNRALRESMGVSGRKIVEERYSLEVNAPKLIELIEKIGARQALI